ATRAKCFAAAEEADRRPRLASLEDVIAPLAPYSPGAVRAEATCTADGEARAKAFGGEAKLPERQAPRHMALQINAALHDLFVIYPGALPFDGDVAQKAGDYPVTRGLQKGFGARRVYNNLRDETVNLRLAQGYANLGLLPVPEIQYLAYFH